MPQKTSKIERTCGYNILDGRLEVTVSICSVAYDLIKSFEFYSISGDMLLVK